MKGRHPVKEAELLLDDIDALLRELDNVCQGVKILAARARSLRSLVKLENLVLAELKVGSTNILSVADVRLARTTLANWLDEHGWS